MDVTMLGDVAPNDLVLVHAGAAITRDRRARWPMTRSAEKHRLPVSVHRRRGDRRHQPARRPRRLGHGARRAKAPDCNRRRLTSTSDCVTAAGTEMADRFRRGGRLYTFGNGGSSTDAATLAVAVQPHPRGAARWRLVAGRRRGGGDRARQRRRLRADLQAADHRPRPRPRHRDRVVDVAATPRT